MKSLKIISVFMLFIHFYSCNNQITKPVELTTIIYKGRTYHTVKIGEQTWLKENLNVGTMIQSKSGGQLQKDNGIIEKYCYDNNEDNCEKYGGLYEWNEAMQYSTEEGSQGICPPGWHIPTYSEMKTLEKNANDEASKLIDTSQATFGYTATNELGFSAMFAGYRLHKDGNFKFLGDKMDFWSSTDRGNSLSARTTHLYSYTSYIHHGPPNKNQGVSVRCLKN